MDIKYELPEETLKALKGELGHGGIGDVAEKCGKHRNEVSNIMNGKVKLTSENVIVITTAQAIIEERKQLAEEKSKALTKSINKTLSA